MKRLLMILMVTLLITGCGASAEVAGEACKKLGEVDTKNEVFKACLKSGQENIYFSESQNLTKAIVLGELVILRSGESEVDGWDEDFKKSIGFRKADAEFMTNLWDAESALRSIELVTQGDERWDDLISSMAKFSNARGSSKKLISRLLSDDKPTDEETSNTLGKPTEIYSDSLSGELEVFLSYLRTETGLSNYEAANVTLSSLRFSES